MLVFMGIKQMSAAASGAAIKVTANAINMPGMFIRPSFKRSMLSKKPDKKNGANDKIGAVMIF